MTRDWIIDGVLLAGCGCVIAGTYGEWGWAVALIVAGVLCVAGVYYHVKGS